MTQSRRTHLALLGGVFSAASFRATAAEPDFSTYTDAQKEKFLTSGKIVSAAEIGHGVTKPVRAELEFGGVKHSGSVQVVNKELPDFFPKEGNPIPMRDSWHYNVAAYRIDRLLDLNMVTVTVPRPYRGKPGAISWWVDDVMFEEVDRIKKGIEPPDPEAFDRQRALSRVLDELIINIDRNLSNLIITKSWKIALIDHSRSFNAYHGIRNEANLSRCSRGLMEKMKALTQASVSKAVGPHLTPAEVAAVLARRDRLVDFFAKAVSQKGEGNVMFS